MCHIHSCTAGRQCVCQQVVWPVVRLHCLMHLTRQDNTYMPGEGPSPERNINTAICASLNGPTVDFECMDTSVSSRCLLSKRSQFSSPFWSDQFAQLCSDHHTDQLFSPFHTPSLSPPNVVSLTQPVGVKMKLLH